MLPHRRGSASHSSSGSGRRPVSDKEEIARAALRSLAGPSASPTSNEAPLLPRPPHPTATYPPALPPPPPPSHPASVYQEARPHDRVSYQDTGSTTAGSSTFSPHDELDRAATTRAERSSATLLNDRSLAASPEPAPTSAGLLPVPPLPSHAPPRHSLPSTPSQDQIHETAVRRASVALGVSLGDVRQIVHNAYASRRTSHSSSTASSSASAPALEYPSGFVRQVLDAYDLEADWAAQPRPPYDARLADRPVASTSSHTIDRGLAPSGTTWRESSRPSHRPAPPPPAHHHLQTDRSNLVAWGSRPDARLPTFESRLPESSSRSAYPPSQDARWYEPSSAVAEPSSSRTTNAPMPAGMPPQRPESPSLFAYEAYRRASNPTALELPSVPPARPAAMVSRASYGSVSDMSRRYANNDAPRGPLEARDNSMYERRVRSIDDYAEQHAIQRHYRHRSGSMMQPPVRAPTLAELEEERRPDRTVRSNFRHSYQPYPPPSGRYGDSLCTVGPAYAPLESPQLSPIPNETQRYANLSQMRSPAAETTTSLASPPSAISAALTPSPLLTSATSSARLRPDSSKHTPGLESDTLSPLHRDSEDPAAESTREAVEHMQIDDGETASEFKPPTTVPRKPRPSRSSSSRADRNSVPIQSTDLSRSEIMQKLQDKVKGRLAAKGTPLPPAAPPSKGKLRASSSLRGSLSRRGGKLGRNGSVKRSASNISTSERADRASAPAVSRADSPARETAVAQESATPNTDPPAAKVRRTSVSIAPPPFADQLATQPSQSASPMPTRKSSPPKTIEEAIAKSVSPKPTVSKSASPANKSVHTPSSIEAALLSPTDTPTPSEAAASHAQTLSRSPVPPEGAVEAPTGQALPADLPGAGQMNAGSATNQQSAKAGADSLVQAAQAKDPTETSSAMA